MAKVKFSIREVDNGYLVESNYKENIRLYGADMWLRKSDLSDEIFADTLPKAVDILRQMTNDYSKAIQEAEMDDKLRNKADKRRRAVFEAIESLTPKGADQEGASIEEVKSVLSHRYRSDEVQQVIDFYLKTGVLLSPRAGYVREKYGKKK